MFFASKATCTAMCPLVMLQQAALFAADLSQPLESIPGFAEGDFMCLALLKGLLGIICLLYTFLFEIKS